MKRRKNERPLPPSDQSLLYLGKGARKNSKNGNEAATRERGEGARGKKGDD